MKEANPAVEDVGGQVTTCPASPPNGVTCRSYASG